MTKLKDLTKENITLNDLVNDDCDIEFYKTGFEISRCNDLFKLVLIAHPVCCDINDEHFTRTETYFFETNEGALTAALIFESKMTNLLKFYKLPKSTLKQLGGFQ